MVQNANHSKHYRGGDTLLKLERLSKRKVGKMVVSM